MEPSPMQNWNDSSVLPGSSAELRHSNVLARPELKFEVVTLCGGACTKKPEKYVPVQALAPLFSVVEVHVDVCPACSGVQETVMVRLQLAAWRTKGEARRRRTRERNDRGRDK